MIVYKCDLCDEVRECSQRELERTEYDICAECWDALMRKLKGKGRTERRREIVTLPIPATPAPEAEPKKPFPGTPPIITGTTEQVH
jgi:hypothetical protein